MELVGTALVSASPKEAKVMLHVPVAFNSIRQFKCCTSCTIWNASVLKVGVPCAL